MVMELCMTENEYKIKLTKLNSKVKELSKALERVKELSKQAREAWYENQYDRMIRSLNQLYDTCRTVEEKING